MATSNVDERHNFEIIMAIAHDILEALTSSEDSQRRILLSEILVSVTGELPSILESATSLSVDPPLGFFVSFTKELTLLLSILHSSLRTSPNTFSTHQSTSRNVRVDGTAEEITAILHRLRGMTDQGAPL